MVTLDEKEILKRTHYIDIGPDKLAVHEIYESHSSKDTQPIVILCHGITYSSLAVYDIPIQGYSFCEWLALYGYRVFMPDYLGYGKSIYSEDIKINSESAVRDLELTVDYIKESGCKGNIGIVGWSWGAQVAGLYVQKTSNVPSALVLYGFKWHIDRSTLPVITGNRRNNDENHLKSDFAVPQTILPDVLEMYVRRALDIDPTSPNGPRVEVLKKDSFLTPELIRIPTLIVHGHLDPGLDWNDSLLFFNRVGSPEKYYSVIYGAHPLHMEKNYRQLLNVLDAFFKNYL
jgi:alpha-beta hydrolase superfamily lysophospholipase